MPAGLVIEITHAEGASAAIRRASASTTGTVRAALASPPAPTVSWPSTPRRERGALVADPAVQATGPQGGEYEVGAAQRRVELGGGAERQRGGARLAGQHGVAAQHVGDHGERWPGRCRRGPPGTRQAAGRELPGNKRHPEAATAENGYAHAPDTTVRRRAAAEEGRCTITRSTFSLTAPCSSTSSSPGCPRCRCAAPRCRRPAWVRAPAASRTSRSPPAASGCGRRSPPRSATTCTATSAGRP